MGVVIKSMSYHEFIWLNQHERNWDILEKIFCKKLVPFYDKFIFTTNEIPFQYPERSLVGHFAIACDRSGLYTLQDFDAPSYIGFRRPDLWIAQIDKRRFVSYLVEFKKDINLQLQYKTKIEIKYKYEKRFNSYEIDEYQSVLSAQQVDYQGVFVAITIFCNKPKLRILREDKDKYDQILSDLKDLWIDRRYWKGCTHFPNFGFYYSISHDTLTWFPLGNDWETFNKIPVAIFVFGWLEKAPK